MASLPYTTGPSDAPYHAVVDDAPFRTPYRSRAQFYRTNGLAQYREQHTFDMDHDDDDLEAPDSLLLEMRSNQHETPRSQGHTTSGRQYRSRTGRIGTFGRRFGFGGGRRQRYERLESDRPFQRGYWWKTWFQGWRSRFSSRERAIYEWTNVDNLDTFFTRVSHRNIYVFFCS
jgi:hypothetical protein